MAKSKHGLGKGLSALIPGATEDFILDDAPKEKPAAKDADTKEAQNISLVSLSKILPSKEQSRMVFDDEKIEELAISIKNHGVLQPLVVREHGKGKYELIAGERRLRGAKKAGLKEVPIIVIEADDHLVAELGLIENLQREDLSPLEESQAFRHMMTAFAYTQESLAETLGKSRSYIGNSLRLLTLSDVEKKFLSNGTMTPGHARALLSVREPEGRAYLLDEIVVKSLSVRQSEDMAKRINEATKEKDAVTRQKKKPAPTGFYKDMENKMRQQFGTKVKIKSTSYGGCIEIDFYNDDDLNRILNMVVEEEKSLL